jgi:hypothetical protein
LFALSREPIPQPITTSPTATKCQDFSSCISQAWSGMPMDVIKFCFAPFHFKGTLCQSIVWKSLCFCLVDTLFLLNFFLKVKL